MHSSCGGDRYTHLAPHLSNRSKPVFAKFFLFLGNASKIYDCKIIALSLVLLAPVFDKVIVELSETKTKNSTVLRSL